MDRLAFFLRDLESAREQLLLFEAEELVVRQFVFAAAGTVQESHMKHDYVLLVGIDAVENRAEVMQRVVIANHHQHIARPDAQPFRSEIVAGLQIELIEFRVFSCPIFGRLLGYGENREENDGECDARNGRNLLRQKIDEAQRDERQGDQSQTHGDFNVADFEIERYTKFSFAAMAVPKDEYGQSFRCEAPHDAERVRFAKDKDIAAAEQDRGNLEKDDQIENVVRGTELPVRMTEPLRQNPVLRNSVQHAVRSHNRRIHRPGQHERADDGDEAAEGNPERQRPGQIHCETADGIVLKAGPHGVRNNHHGEERHARREDQAVDENNEARLFEILQFRMLDLAINLRHGLFAAHGENRMTQSDQNSDKTDRVRKRRVLQPTQCIVGIDKVGEMGPWRDLRATQR